MRAGRPGGVSGKIYGLLGSVSAASVCGFGLWELVMSPWSRVFEPI